MGLFSKLFSLIKAIVKKLVKAIVDFIKKFWWVILIIVVIWFAPAIAAWLVNAGAPTWLSSAMTWVGSTVTPYLTSAGNYLWSGVSKLAGAGWNAFTGANIGTQAAIVTGAAGMIAPEETAEFLEAAAETAIDLVGNVVGAVSKGLFGGGLGKGLLFVGGGLGLWWLLKDDDPPKQRQVAQPAPDLSYGRYVDKESSYYVQ